MTKYQVPFRPGYICLWTSQDVSKGEEHVMEDEEDYQDNKSIPRGHLNPTRQQATKEGTDSNGCYICSRCYKNS